MLTTLFIGSLAFAAGQGFWADADDISSGSHIHNLATFGLTNLKQHCTASNSLVCSRLGDEASLVQVMSAQTQVVSGTNFQIEADVSIGRLHLRVYEQPWTNTLTITQASLTVNPTGASLAMLSGALIDEALELEAAALMAIEHPCNGGKVFNQCGSACEATCETPVPMCIRMCVAKCQCPTEKPLWQDNRCIAASECDAEGPTPAPVKPVTTRASAIMVGGALGLGGGHYTGSDAQRPPPPAVEPSATEASPSPEIAFPVMIGGAPGLGGGHYTGSDAELLGAAAKQPASGPGALVEKVEVTSPVVWVMCAICVLLVTTIFLLLVKRSSRSDEQPIISSASPRSSEVQAAEVQAKKPPYTTSV